MVSVDVKHHVYLLTYEEIAQVLLIGMDFQKIDSRPIFYWISRHICQTNRRLKVAKTRSWVLPFCAQQSVPLTSRTMTACVRGKAINHVSRHFFCSSLVKRQPEELKFEANE